MKMSYPIMAVIAVAFLGGCATKGQTTDPTQVASNFINRQHVVATTKDTYPAKNAKNVALFSEHKTPHAPYRVIGVATVSKYNILGMKREDETIHTMMKNLAASIGGDGIIDVSSNHESMKANIIAFQKILI
ncbi:YajG family lipoprotein [Aquicella lusitana]|uniref:Uncharacterized protein n=1 Tax=Aquicella lusitana TaxID=254246 RepID=A0A370H199_9COXI|nr:hypothetical protein [Aquicella lusitana]RDI48775.1 hypothetical protein C8D86_10154 [Aquicella lusitana]VVC73203.1 hypothetical protein AQULUS_09350 [Aquicella lusitana]